MKKYFSKHVEKVGLPPGSLIYIGDKSSKQITQVIKRVYNRDQYSETRIEKTEDITIESDFVTWVHLYGFENIEMIKIVGAKFNLHSMILEDILNTEHLAKFDETDEQIVFFLKSFYKNEKESKLELNHNCIVFNENSIALLQEKKSNYLDAKIERIKAGQGKARRKKADYLFYVLLDAFVDSYFLALNEIENEISTLEEKLIAEPNNNRIEEIHNLKKELLEFKKYLFPLSDAFTQLLKEIPDQFSEENYIYLFDIRDHLKQLKEDYSSCTEMIKGLIELNETNINNSNNQVMKVLTIIATIFIPLTFIAGLYGMNFKNMPELEWEYGYFFALLFMFVIGIVTVVFMKFKKWL